MRINKKLFIVILISVLNFSAQPLLSQYAGGTGTADDPFLIETAEQMNTIGLHREHWDKSFKLIADIDLSAYTGEQYNIIGFLSKDNTTYFPFSGVFNGNGHTISNFTYSSVQINVNDVGIFGQLGVGSLICDLILVDPNIDVRSPAGALVGVLSEGNINNCSVLGGSVSGNTAVGGLVGNNWVDSGESNITKCCSTATVSGNEWVGGLVGANFGLIKECFATGSVSGNADIGGLVGWNGMLGGWPGKGKVLNCYAASSVSGGNNVGGLVGSGSINTTVTNCYAIGSVSGNRNVGGLVGQNSGKVTQSFWDIDSSRIDTSNGGTGKTTAEMQTRSTFTSVCWDFSTAWMINEGQDYPRLLWEVGIHDSIVDPNDPVENLTTGQRFGSIQCAINSANSGDEIVIAPGTHKESIDLMDKALLIRSSNPENPAITTATIIQGDGNKPVVTLNVDSSLQGLSIIGGSSGIVCEGTLQQISGCRIVKNQGAGIELRNQSNINIYNCIIAGNNNAGIKMIPDNTSRFIYYNTPTISNCTIAENIEEGISGGKPTITNCIIYNNGSTQIDPISAKVTYSNIQGDWPEGIGNIDADPCFAEIGYWDVNDTPDDVSDDRWVAGDYHLKSQAGRWDPNNAKWIQDDVTSPCIDAGDIVGPIGSEPFPNGGVINMGAYGGTAQASKSYFGEPVCETIVAGDINGDCEINFLDFQLMALHWMEAK
jgi:hypothetical protein